MKAWMLSTDSAVSVVRGLGSARHYSELAKLEAIHPYSGGAQLRPVLHAESSECLKTATITSDA